MDKVKEIAKDPAKLEAKIKEYWAKIDTEGKGSLPFEDYRTRAVDIAKSLNLPSLTSDQQKEQAKKILDPTGSGIVTFEGFKNFIEAGIKNLKKEGQI